MYLIIPQIKIVIKAILIIIVNFLVCKEDYKETRQALFVRVFKEYAILDSETVKRVKKNPLEKRHYIDRNNDGRPEEVWFISTRKTLFRKKSPILVRVIDEDGDFVTRRFTDEDDDVCGWLTKDEINEIMQKVAQYEWDEDHAHDQVMNQMIQDLEDDGEEV